MLTWLRELAATVGSFDRSALEPGYALRCTVGVAIPLVLATAFGKPAFGVAAAIGAFITGFTSLQGVHRTRLVAILAAAAGMSLTSFIGALAAHSTPGVIAAAAVAGYLCGTLGQLGPAAATVTLNSLVAFVLFSSQPLPAGAALEQSGLVLGGGLVQALLVIAVWPVARYDAERAALADVYKNLAAYARGIQNGATEFPPLTPFATARQIFADPQPFARSAEIARLSRLLEDSETIRKRLGALTMSHAIPPAVAEHLDAIAGSLRGRPLSAPGDVPETPAAPDLAAAIRDAAAAAAVLSSGRLPNVHLLSKARPGPYVENHVVWLSRESLRFAIVLGIAMALGRALAADRGYWIPMTAALVLKPDFQTTFVRGFARIGGTLAGAVVATGVIVLVRGQTDLELAGILLTTAAAYIAFNPNYALFTVAITSFVVLVLNMRGLPGTTTIADRIVDTLIGGGLGMAGYLALPTWEHKRTRALLADLIDAQRALAVAILAAYEEASPETLAAIDMARTAVWRARIEVEASVDRTRHEPLLSHTIGAARALRILAASQRLGLANLALETIIETRPARMPAMPVGAFRRALDERLTELARALRESRRPTPDNRLETALAALESQLPSQAQTQVVVDSLASYTEAIARLTRLIKRNPDDSQRQRSRPVA